MGGERAEEFAEIQNPPERGSWKLCLGCVMRMDNLGTLWVLSPGETESWRQAGDTVERPGWTLLQASPTGQILSSGITLPRHTSWTH